MRKPNLDVDIVVEGDGIEFARKLAQIRNAEITKHEQFGTSVVILPDGFKIDVATARTETYAHPGALPSVDSGLLNDDLHRRDFTINAMAIGLNERGFGRLIDFFGGKADLDDGWIRILHDGSFEDDPTRIFRAIRFERRHGFSIEPHTEELLIKAFKENLIEKITGQRLRNEILMILREDNPVPALYRMADFGLLKYIHPNISLPNDFAELFNRLKEVVSWWNSTSYSEDSKVDPILLSLIALLEHLDISEIEDTCARLAFTKKYRDTLKIASNKLPNILNDIIAGPKSSGRIYNILNNIPLEVLLFAMVRLEKGRDAVVSYLTELRHIKPLLNGEDICRLGYQEGPIYTQILNQAFAAQLDGLIQSKSAAISFVKINFSQE